MPASSTAWATSIGGLTFGLQHGGKYLRYAYLGGVDLAIPAPTGKIGAGIGGHLPLGPLFLDADLLLFWVVPFGESIDRVSLQPQLKLALGWQLARRFAIFAGIAANALWSGLDDAEDLAPSWAREIPQQNSTRVFTWPDLHAGVRF